MGARANQREGHRVDPERRPGKQWKAGWIHRAKEWAQTVPDGAKVLDAFRAEVAAARK